ncbi:MAG: 5'/3'-nucleotidase SurE [Planctomycetes bacterium]|nr:5'/3'-nucleotidase SurE [Planctomycetota bacterium]
MRILVSNDDGILAPGLAALCEAVADLGDLSVVAPDSPQSATGHSITLTHPLTVQQVRVQGLRPFVGMSVDGRPADCVRLAIKALLPQPPDLVLSGINAGANAGINVFYSGTVAAAVEAAMCGIPAVAFSAGMTGGPVDFARTAKLCRWALDRLLAGAGLRKGDLINVNIPPNKPGWPLGVRVAHQSTAGLDDSYVKCFEENGKASYRLSDDYDFAHKHDQTDVHGLGEGYITITPLRFDLTDYDGLSALEKITWGQAPRAADPRKTL